MTGCYSLTVGIRNKQDERGVIPNSFNHVFTHISRSQDEQYLVRASYLEIYQEEIRDLLNKDHEKRLELRERPDTGVYVKDLSSFVAKSVKEIEHVMNVGNKNRAVGYGFPPLPLFFSFFSPSFPPSSYCPFSSLP